MSKNKRLTPFFAASVRSAGGVRVLCIGMAKNVNAAHHLPQCFECSYFGHQKLAG